MQRQQQQVLALNEVCVCFHHILYVRHIHLAYAHIPEIRNHSRVKMFAVFELSVKYSLHKIFGV